MQMDSFEKEIIVAKIRLDIVDTIIARTEPEKLIKTAREILMFVFEDSLDVHITPTKN